MLAGWRGPTPVAISPTPAIGTCSTAWSPPSPRTSAGSDVGRQEPDQVLETEPQRDQAYRDAHGEGDPPPTSAPRAPQPDSDPAEQRECPEEQRRRPCGGVA